MSLGKCSSVNICYKTAPSPICNVFVAYTQIGLVSVNFNTELSKFQQRLVRLGYPQNLHLPSNSNSNSALDQIIEYLEGKRTRFDISIDWNVCKSKFQKLVLETTFNTVHYGCTCSYGEIAQRIGNCKAARAVGRAQASNPLPIVIPCHRIVKGNGTLHGYSAGNGTSTKLWLLELEKRSSDL